ncbi:hypothetical protein [Polaribacter pacificus]|uniref:hypothetical protein n=1 Tax=Polaribacter pacificus TaxID=1775173 RepID=UPI00166E666C|nr:hypothetical protein [Polaribacter pacificus]
MKKSNNYLLLSALFILGFLVIQYTDIYGDAVWFKWFLIIAGASFLIGSVTERKKERKK